MVGAGIAGCALALALKQNGLPVRVYERDDEPTARGMVELTANGSRVLHALGLKSVLAHAATVPDFATIRSAATGFLLGQRALGQFSEARYGAPCYLIDAADLTRVLRRACADADVSIELATEVADIETHTATLVMNAGTDRAHLAVAVASGLPMGGSSGLAELLERRPTEPAQCTVVRARLRRKEPYRDHHRFINTWLFAGGFCIERPLPADSGEQWVELVAATSRDRDGEPAEALLDRILAPAHPILRSLQRHPAHAEFLDAPLVPPADHWHAGRVALLGGICHAPPAHATYGPSAALEDGWVLSRMMERSEEAPHQDLAEFERFRKPRAWRLRAHADAEFRTLTLDRAGAIWRRNLKWSLTSRFLPEISMERLDWLYGYDCIKGFA